MPYGARIGSVASTTLRPPLTSPADEAELPFNEFCGTKNPVARLENDSSSDRIEPTTRRLEIDCADQYATRIPIRCFPRIV